MTSFGSEEAQGAATVGRGRGMQVSESVVIDFDAETIWTQVADPTQMPRWSPENTDATTPRQAGH